MSLPRPFSPFFLIAISLLLSLNALAQTSATVPNTTGNSTAERNQLFIQALLRAYYDNPNLFRLHQLAVQGDFQTAQMIRALQATPAARKTYRMLFDPLGNGPSPDVISWDNHDRNYIRQQQDQLIGQPGAAAQTATAVCNLLYSPHPSPAFSQLYTLSHTIQGATPLPSPGTIDELKQSYPAITKQLEIPGLSQQQVGQLCLGQLDKQQLDQILVQNGSSYQAFIVQLFNANVFMQTPPDKPVSNTAQSAELDDQKKAMDAAKADLYAGSSILALIDPKDAKTMSDAGKAGISIYTGLSTMLINGAIDATSLGDIFSGVGTIVSLLGGDGTGATLNQILQNELKMMKQLSDIQNKVDALQGMVSYLIELGTYDQQQLLNGINDITNHLNAVQSMLFSNVDDVQDLDQQSKISDLTNAATTLIEDFNNDAGSQDWQNRLNAIAHPDTVDETSKIYFDKVYDQLNQIAVLATQQLEDTGDIFSNKPLQLDNMPTIAQLVAKENLDINQRMNLLPSIGSWIYRHLVGGATAPVQYAPAGLDLFPLPGVTPQHDDGSGLSLVIGNPTLLCYLFNLYTDLSRYRLLLHKTDGTVIIDPNMAAFCARFNDLASAISAMRSAIPVAVGVVNFYLLQLKQMEEKFVYDEAQKQGLTDPFAKDPHNSIYFAGLPANAIQQQVAGLSNELFFTAGIRLNLFKLDTPVGGSEEPGHPDRLDDSVYRLLLTPNAVQTYGSHDPWIWRHCQAHFYNGALTSDPCTNIDPNGRKLFEGILAKEIIDKEKQIELDWGNSLTKNQDLILGSLFKSKLAFETLILGGYGPQYAQQPELDTLAKFVRRMDSLVDFITQQWEQGQQVIEKPVKIATVDGPSMSNLEFRIDPYEVFWHSNTTVSPFQAYFDHNALFSTVYDPTNTETVELAALIPNYNLPTTPWDSRFLMTNRIADVRHCLSYAAQFADLAPGAACLALFPVFFSEHE